MNAENQLIMIPIEKLEPHPDNPRKDVGDVTELANSIKHSGIMQNLTVVPHEGKYRVIIGHRRLAAAKAAGLTELPCMVADMNYKEQCGTMLSENMQRIDLTPIEQAQGVQMMLDLGETVEQIAEKTGFSKSTIAKRAKIAKLPFEKLKAAEARGATIEEYTKVVQIEDEKKRNEVLSAAGTRDFEWKLNSAIRAQKAKKFIPLMLAEAKKVAEEMKNPNERWGTKYTTIGNVSVDDFEKNGAEAFEEYKNKKEISWVKSFDSIEFYKKVKKHKVEPIQKSEKEIAADKAKARLADLTRQAFELRKAFLDEFNTFTAKNEKIIEEAIVLFSALKIAIYDSSDFDFMKKCIEPFKKTNGYSVTFIETQKWFYHDKKKAKLQLLRALINDKAQNGFYCQSYGEKMPRYQSNEKLQAIYNVLTELGYKISTEEMQLMNGTHEVFKDGENNE